MTAFHIAGKLMQADHLAVRINRLIARCRSKLLSGASNHDTKQLWELLKKTDNWGGKSKSAIDLDSDIINDYFATVATDAKLLPSRCYVRMFKAIAMPK